MGSAQSTPSLGVVAFVVVVAAAYHASLPKPLPGIPYHKYAAWRPFGDAWGMVGHVLRTGRVFDWVTSATTTLNSPIAQLFVRSTPWVVVTDPFESQDILHRRNHEFDRSSLVGDMLAPILPTALVHLPSADPRFKRNRALVSHLMTPSFLNAISGPQIYHAVQELVELWEAKLERVPPGTTWDAHADIKYSALDLIFATLFGGAHGAETDSAMTRRKAAVEKGGATIKDNEATFPNSTLPPILQYITAFAHAANITVLSPAPYMTAHLMQWVPSVWRATKAKDAFIHSRIQETIPLVENNKGRPLTAMHSVLLREKEMADAEGVPPMYHRPEIVDEFLTLTVAGHDTTTSATAWGVKYLAGYPQIQTTLRSRLHAAFPRAVAEGRPPTCDELNSTRIPYMDAFVHEVLRLSRPFDFLTREALVDTVVLGHRIPKGTDVFLMYNGPGYLAPMMNLPDEQRSPGARVSSGKPLSGLWERGGEHLFDPTRWLVRDGDDAKFAPQAGPFLGFGLGPRACLGKKLALMALRTYFALLVWEFEFGGEQGWEGVQRATIEPRECLVKLASL